MVQKFAPPEKNSTDMSAISAPFCISENHLSMGHVEKSPKVGEGLTDGELHEKAEKGTNMITHR